MTCDVNSCNDTPILLTKGIWKVALYENMTGGSLQEICSKMSQNKPVTHVRITKETKLRVKDSLTTNELSWMPFAMFY